MMYLSEIARQMGVKLESYHESEIQWLLTDSRNLSFPENSLFFALKTVRNDGHKYINELYHRNLRYFVVSRMLPEFESMSDAVFLQVDDVLESLQRLATYHRQQFRLPVVGITGSNGKTIVKEWIFQMLQSDMQICRSPRSYNSQIGVPLSVWNLDSKDQLAVFEAGISQPDEMRKLEQIILPTIGIFTNIGDAHQEFFTNLSEKCIEKAKLFCRSDKIIYCADDLLIDETLHASCDSGEFISWGKADHCRVRVVSVTKSGTVTHLSLSSDGEDMDLDLPFTDSASIENIMHCITLLLTLGYNAAVIQQRLSRLEGVAMRLEVKEGIGQSTIINDTYNSDINSLIIALDFLNQQAIDREMPRTVILSDLLQGSQQDKLLYMHVNSLLKAKSVNKIIGVGETICSCREAFEGIDGYFFRTTEELLQSSVLKEIHKEIVLVKGSRYFQFERVTESLNLKKHETILDVNLNNLVENFNYFKSYLKPSTRVMCMVKAFAYGSGSVEVAKTLQHHQCDYLAVAVADEGVELRREGIHIPIVVMNPEQASFSSLFDHNLEPEIYSFVLLRQFVKATHAFGVENYPVHLKFDTGMHRLGFDPEETVELIDFLKSQGQIKVKSVFSHLAGADDKVLDDFTLQQIEVFSSLTQKIEDALDYPILKHILNSAGTERWSDYQFDMVRLGIGHYGISARPEVSLKQVCSLKTVVLQIKNVKAGETVGYSRKGKVYTDTTIAILPLGYADGFNRKFSNGLGEVFVNGHRAKVIGNVSMDLTTIDITGLQVHEGDPVEIFGDHITLSELAEKLGTIPYEILTNVSRRVRRVYFKE